MFKALVLEAKTLIPNIAPEEIKSSEIIEGDGVVGSIVKLTFGEGSQSNYKIEAIDKENLGYSYSLIEGDARGDSIEEMSCENKFEAGPDGGWICKIRSMIYTKGDDIAIKEEDVKAGKEKTVGPIV